MKVNLLILAGLGDSGEKHWQTYWQAVFPNTQKVMQKDWDNPKLEEWLLNLKESLSTIDRPTVLVAHSLAVSLVLHWAMNNSNNFVKGAFLVAPADVDSSLHTPESIRNFAPMPLFRLPFPSVVIASENDPYADFERKKFFAENWGSDFVNVGKLGHINSDSDLKKWDEGQQILKEFLAKYSLLTNS